MSLLGRHLTGLADFSSRENREPFWLWILICYAVHTVASMIIMIPLMMSMLDRMAPMMQGDPHRFDSHPELVFQMIAPMMSGMMVFYAVLGVVWLALIAAAVVRRLHDSDRSGWWASPVFVLHVVGPLLSMSTFPQFFGRMGAIRKDMTPDQVNAVMMPAMQSFMWVWLIGMIGFVIMIVLIVFLCQPGTRGQNRYGDDPLTSL
jgi:uncharacterized membrane protein YhaH (DUF805 family)